MIRKEPCIGSSSPPPPPKKVRSSPPPPPKKVRKESAKNGNPKRLEFGGEAKRLDAIVLPHLQGLWKKGHSTRVSKHVPLIFATGDGKELLPLAYTLLRYSSARRGLCKSGAACTCEGMQVDIVQVGVAKDYQKRGWGTRIACAIYRVAAAFGRSLYLEQCITPGSKALGESLLRKGLRRGCRHGQSYFYECGQVPPPYRNAGLRLSIVSERSQPTLFAELYAELA
jgi:hypothetical protein